MKTKNCFKCKQDKPLDDFYRHAQMADGRVGKCKTCARDDSITNRNKNIEKYPNHDKVRNLTPERKSYFLAKTQKLRARTGVESAHNAVARAISGGSLIRPDHCTRCLIPCTPQGHHDDHSKPLDVLWLCPVCHAFRHQELGRLGHHAPRKPAPGGVADPSIRPDVE